MAMRAPNGDIGRRGIDILSQASDDGVDGAAWAYAQALARSRSSTASANEILAPLELAIAQDNQPALLLSLQMFRYGLGNRVRRDRDRALALLDAHESRLSPEIAARERLAIRTAQLAPLDELGGCYASLPAATRSSALVAAYRSNKNGFVYLVQDELAARGIYAGNRNGLLTTSTIRAIAQFCGQVGIQAQCSRGPLRGDVAADIAEQLAATRP